uniref:Cadherin domain-containing protein n=1 Tax=Anopheles dirus TaxID=7168 RepID=A0A182NH33_9DIPT
MGLSKFQLIPMRCVDPEGSKLRFSISGPVFSVDRDSGVVRLRQSLDREQQDTVEVIISLTDEGILGTEPNTVSLRREIPIRDYNDNPPVFVGRPYSATISESTKPGSNVTVTPDIIATDQDEGMNAELTFSCYQDPAKGADDICEVFTVHTEKIAQGKFGAWIELRRPLDFETRPSYILSIQARDGSTTNSLRAVAAVAITIVDVQDQPPIFVNAPYSATIPENTIEGTRVLTINATDGDTGSPNPLMLMLENEPMGHFRLNYIGPNSRYTLALRNIHNSAGVFAVVPTHGEGRTPLVVKVLDSSRLDYDVPSEDAKTFRFQLVASVDGEEKSTANVTVRLQDANDNSPAFPQSTYALQVRENSPRGGEIKITRPVSSMDTDRGQYELLVVATDHGVPALKNDTRVLVRVGLSGNQRPIFRGHATAGNRDIPGPPSYRASIPENAPAGYSVTQVSATDPDGLDELLRYKIVGASDNFVIDDHTGRITVTRDARLDRDTNPESYAIVVNAIDAGFPIPETATTTVHVKIQDINDKPPRFTQQTYTAYVSERSPIDSEVLRVTAKDTDLNAQIEYTLVEPITAVTKGGIPLLTTSSYDYRQAFRIDRTNGTIFVNSTLNYNYAAVITLTVRATDTMAEVTPDKQFDQTEVTLYVQSFKDTNPLFKNKGWSTVRPKIEVKVKEEAPVGSVVFRIEADDPVSDVAITDFELVMPDVDGIFGLNERTGEIMLLQRLDYETYNKTTIDFVVKAITANRKRHSLAYVNVTVENVNDNAPSFERDSYRVTVLESDRYPAVVATAKATDQDAVRTERDRLLGYSVITYSLFGSHSNLFTIDNSTGEIRIAPGQVLDREKQSVLKLVVVAEDAPGRPQEAKKTTVEIMVDVLDVNDNAPIFGQRSYTAVIPENVLVDTFVIAITAHDPDEGLGGEVRYDILNEGEANGLLQINPKTGEIKTKAMLTGKGRAEPYELVIRAQDSGSQLPKQSSLYNDVSFTLYIGDISANDGIPFFIAPQVGQTANVTENATVGAPVFQVIASDPDSPATPSGTLRYRIQSDIEDAKSFSINPKTGLITTTRSLDREVKSAYNVIIEVSDMGEPPQASTVVLRINVLDIDDHEPRFVREVEAQPYELEVLEEQPAGTIVGNVSALDEDVGSNGAIDYTIIEGNELGLFKITRTEDSRAVLRTTKPLDRESLESVRLTVRCFKFNTVPEPLAHDSYQRNDRSQQQVLIRVIDIDDHAPRFERENQTIGIRHNVPIDTPIANGRASDEDPTARPIVYSIRSINFVPQFYRRDNRTEDYTGLFSLNAETAEIRTTRSMSNFVDGYFQLSVRAANSDDPDRISETQMKIFVIRDKSLLRFVFSRPPTEVSGVLDRFTADMQQRLADANLELSVFDAQVLSHPDHSLDFSSTSSCFQLTRHGSALTPVEMMRIMDGAEMKETLAEVYHQYSVHKIDSCAVGKKPPASALIASSGTWLVILAGLIGFAAFASTMTACCLAKRYKSQVRSTINSQRIVGSDIYGSATPVLYTEPIYGAL